MIVSPVRHHNNNNTSREIHDPDIEDEIREAFRWIYLIEIMNDRNH